MILIVGLGNPGKKYKNTPHNMGFRVVDTLKKTLFPRALWKKRFEARFLRCEVEGEKVIFLKPLTYMNRSGLSVKDALGTFSLSPESLWVVHDEYDLPWGTLKIDVGRSSAGHKGVRSIVDALSSNAFWRFRVGIKPEIPPEVMDGYLTSFNIKTHLRGLDEAIVTQAGQAILDSLRQGIAKKNLALTVPAGEPS